MVPSPSTANTGAFGSASRAASANDSAPPIEPVTPLISAAAPEHALAPLRELAAVADRARCRDRARRTGAARGTPRRDAAAGRLRACRRRPCRRPVVERGARLGEPGAVARSARGARDQRLGARQRHRRSRAEQQALALFPRGALDQRGVRIDRDQAHAGSTNGASPKRSVKSSALPSSTIRSARAMRSEKAPSVDRRCRAGFP